MNEGADSVAVAAPSAQLQREPVISRGRGVPEEFGAFADSAHNHVDSSVTIEISKGGAAMSANLLEILARRRADV
jgi:hypothetical protein